MNIVKIKDTVKPNDVLWNKFFKGKYAFWIHMRYLVPLEHMSIGEYVKAEQSGCVQSEYHVDTLKHDVDLYIDYSETERLFNVNKYLNINKFVPVGEITMDDIRNFRSWMAGVFYDLSSEATGQHVWNFYKNSMWDEVCKWLCLDIPTQQVQATLSGCGCNTSLHSLQVNGSCDPLLEYRRRMKATLVKMFTLQFLTEQDPKVLNQIRLYIESILASNLVFGASKDFKDCSCGTSQNELHLRALCERFAKTLSAIIDGSWKERINYHTDNTKNWIDQVYELMTWVTKK